MKRKYLRFLIIIILATPLALLFTRCSEGYRSISVAALSGSARVDRERQSVSISAYEGMKLQNLDFVTVADSSRVIFKLDDDKYVYLEPGTQIKIAAKGKSGGTKTDIKLLKGSMSAVIKKKLHANDSFNVTVDNVSMMVRGTIFRISLVAVENGDATVTIQTIEGEVEIDTGDADPSRLGANLQSVILLNDTGGTFESMNTPIDYTEIPSGTLQWMQEALQDKLNAATDQGEINTLNNIISLVGVQSSPEPTPPPVPTIPPTETLASTVTLVVTPSATSTLSPTETFTETPTTSPTRPFISTPTEAPITHPTRTSTSTLTEMPTATLTQSSTPFPIEMPTATPTQPETSTLTETPTETPTQSATITPTETLTATPICTSTAEATKTPEATSTRELTATPSNTPTEIPTTLPTYLLSMEQPAHGVIIVQEGFYEAHANIPAEAIPDSGYELSGWLVNGILDATLGEETSISFTMPASDTTISAEFKSITYSLTYKQPGYGGGVISMIAGQYAQGEHIHITVTPDQNMMLAWLIINGEADYSYQGLTEIDYVMPDKDVVITARFQLLN